MLRQNINTPISEFLEKAKAPLQHLFNDHEHCSDEWCLALKAKAENKAYNHLQGWLSVNIPEQKNLQSTARYHLQVRQ